MKYALWEVHLEDLRIYLQYSEAFEFQGRNFPVPPKMFEKNIVQLAKTSISCGVPAVREAYLFFRKGSRMFIDGRKKSDYYAIMYNAGTHMEVEPDRFAGEIALVEDMVSCGVRDILLVGSHASQCVLSRAEKLSEYFHVIVPIDSVFDTSYQRYSSGMKAMGKLGVEFVCTGDLDGILSRGVNPVRSLSHSSKHSPPSGALCQDMPHGPASKPIPG